MKSRAMSKWPRQTVLPRAEPGPNAALHTTDKLHAAHAMLDANSTAYQRLLRRATLRCQKEETSETLKRVVDAATFACRFHTGRFADGALENLLLRIGRAEETVGPTMRERPRRAQLRVLHVATSVLSVGGHTRMMHRWIAEDHGNRHSVALTRQGQRTVPTWLSDEIESTGGQVIVLDAAASDLDRAQLLRAHARESADLVVLHHGGADTIPTLAFATDGGPPVAVLNHADHLFWLGSSVADLCIDLRSITNAYSIARRHIPRTVVLPIPLQASLGRLDRSAARRELGIDMDAVVLLTVARAIKFRPCGGQDFMATVERILNEDPSVHLYVVGETTEGMTRQLNRALHARIHCAGTIENPDKYRAAADLYIESFPFGSNTALLEAALDGLPVVPACRPLSTLLVACNDSLLSSMTNPADEAEYCERIRAFTRDPEGRQAYGLRLRNELLKHHVGEAWRAHLQGVYRAASQLPHRPRTIPVTACEKTPCDLGLSLYGSVPDGRTGSGTEPHTKIGALRHSAFVARHARDFQAARSFSFLALRTDLFGRETWRLFLVSLLGPVAPVVGDTWRRYRRKVA